jgi:hypothetical protein
MQQIEKENFELFMIKCGVNIQSVYFIYIF